jgi:hypothetical protein
VKAAQGQFEQPLEDRTPDSSQSTQARRYDDALLHGTKDCMRNVNEDEN